MLPTAPLSLSFSLSTSVRTSVGVCLPNKHHGASLTWRHPLRGGWALVLIKSNESRSNASEIITSRLEHAGCLSRFALRQGNFVRTRFNFGWTAVSSRPTASRENHDSVGLSVISGPYRTVPYGRQVRWLTCSRTGGGTAGGEGRGAEAGGGGRGGEGGEGGRGGGGGGGTRWNEIGWKGTSWL